MNYPHLIAIRRNACDRGIFNCNFGADDYCALGIADFTGDAPGGLSLWKD